ncbi:MAG: hypothetical protein DWQ42_21005 [Planctomycetota bacterium]|nr:MAG: hypothetical protein DWQ42_21005 [Planctomycetota bacterium]REK40221.1 MAG: hypothetical protein DWQ46_16895 [Planctomycetota bacterium]
MMTRPDYTLLHQKLTSLVAQLQNVLTESERGEVDEFIAVGEYGVALETVAAIIMEEDKRISASQYSSIMQLADIMGLGGSLAASGFDDAVKAEQ